MNPLCKLGRHKVSPNIFWNRGVYFAVCRRCGKDIVRTGNGHWHVPSGYRVVWQKVAPRPVSPARGARRLDNESRKTSILPIQYVLDRLQERNEGPETPPPYTECRSQVTSSATRAILEANARHEVRDWSLDPAVGEAGTTNAEKSRDLGSALPLTAHDANRPAEPESGPLSDGIAALHSLKEKSDPDEMSEAAPHRTLRRSEASDFMDEDEGVSAWDAFLADDSALRKRGFAGSYGIEWANRSRLVPNFGRSRRFRTTRLLSLARWSLRKAKFKLNMNMAADGSRKLAGGAALAILAIGLGISALLSEGGEAPMVALNAGPDNGVGMPGVVAPRLLNCRSSPALGAEILLLLRRGQKVDVRATEDAWASVEIAGRQCWVWARYIILVEPSDPARRQELNAS